MKQPAIRTASPLGLTLALLVATLALGGCLYRPDIQQGNLLTVEDVDQVNVGMTRSQVRYLLGTPMISDPFAPHRWDYVYRLTHGRPRRTDTAHFLVRFEGDTVVAVEKIDAPERHSSIDPTRAPATVNDDADGAAAASPDGATVVPPQPEAARPDAE